MYDNYIALIFEDLELLNRQAPKVRGFFAKKYDEYSIAHNHEGDKFIYRYPLIQYKVINNKPILIGIGNEAIGLIKNIWIEDFKVNIDGQLLECYQKSILINKFKLGFSNEIIQYEFETPWICLNQKNIKIYNNSNIIEKELLLKNILVGNILSFAKGVGFFVEDKILVKLDVKEKKVNYKGNKFIGFVGTFWTNFEIPDYVGIGKSVARGFGTVVRS